MSEPTKKFRVIDGDQKAPTKKAAPTSETQTEIDLANRFVSTSRGDFRYASGRWLAFDGQRWAPDNLEAVRECAKLSAQSVCLESAALLDPALFNLGVKAASAKGVAAVLTLARSDPRVATRADAFDANPMLVNVMNGTLDLGTMQLRPHSRDDLITKLAPVVYDPEARSDLWEKYLRDALGDDDLIAFVQRCAGYSLSGDGSEEKAFLCIGPTRCGKGTFADAISAAFGDYARSADFRTFLTDRHEAGGSARPDLFRLIGARFVTTSEVSSTARFDEARLKSLTGRDAMDVRQLYGETVSTRPSFKLWFNANVSPRISDDAAVWARLYKISFDRLAAVPIEQRDPTMKTRLTDIAANRAAIFAWAVHGCADWQRQGLAPPACVLTATKALRDDLDSARRFLTAHVLFDPEASTTTEALVAAYTRWCAEEGDEPVSTKALTAALKTHAKAFDLTVANTRKKGLRAWRTVKIELGDDTAGANDGE